MGRRARSAVLVLAMLFMPVLAACGSKEPSAETEALLAQVKDATKKYRDVKLAERDGYAAQPECSELSGEGAMGLHYTNEKLAKDPKVDLLKPEELLYEPQPGGKPPRLVGVEYFVTDTGIRPPRTAFGHLDGPMPGHFPGQPRHFDQHVWIFKDNRNGVFDMWNPDVKCRGSTNKDFK